VTKRHKDAYRTIHLHFSRRGWKFLVALGILGASVGIGTGILWYTGHAEYRSLLGVAGLAKVFELLGAAAVEAFDEA